MLSKVIFWKYQRGTLQYDILCALILAFIFLTPKGVFDGSLFSEKQKPKIEQEKDSKPEKRNA